MAAHPEHDDLKPGTMTDAQVIEALRRGDEAAFTSLVDRYHRSLVRLANVVVHDRAIAEDVAQDAWMGFLLSLPRFEGRSSVKTWLFAILQNCARARSRGEGRAITFSDAGLEFAGAPSVHPERFQAEGQRWPGHWADPPEAWPEEHALGDEVRQCIQRAVDRLPRRQRLVVTLRDIEGWSSDEVCAALGVTEGNQRVLLHRARSAVRGELERYFAGRGEGTEP